MTKNSIFSIVLAILFIGFACLLLVNSTEFMESAIKVFGYIGVCLGICSLFLTKKNDDNSFIQMAIVLILYGLIAILKADLLLAVIPVLFGGYFIFRNANRLSIALKLSKEKNKLALWIICFSCLNLILSLCLIINPFSNLSPTLLLSLIIIICESLGILMDIILVISKK